MCQSSNWPTVELAEFSTFPQHPCGKPEDGRAMRPKRSLACAWALLIPHTYYRRTRCICQACVETNIKLKVYCLRAPMHICCGPMHIYFAAACGHRCILPADRMYMACGGDAHIPRNTLWPSERHRSTLSRFQSFMLTFARFYGRLHAKITRLSTIRIYTQSIKNLDSHPPPKNTQLN